MPYGVVWSHDAPESGKRRLVSAPEAIESVSVEEAKKEGLQILAELSPEQKACMKPLSIVEVDEKISFTLGGCDRVFLPMTDDDGELEFVDVTNVGLWSSQPWWSR